MSNRERRLKFSMAGIIAGFGLYTGYIAWNCLLVPLEEPQEIQLSIPSNADVQIGANVQPGTFTVAVSLREFLNRARDSDQRALVTYGLPAEVLSETDYVRVRYWLPRTDVAGTFYYAEDHVPVMGSRASTIGLMNRRGDTLIVSPDRNVNDAIAWGALTFMLMVAACAFFFDARHTINAVKA